MSKDKPIRVFCRNCKLETNHDKLYENITTGEIKEIEEHWWETVQVLKCRGCEATVFRKVYGDTIDFDPQTGEPEETETLYPNPRERKPIIGSEHFPIITRHIYLETLKAFNNNAPLLTAIGLRAIVESICLDKKVKGRNLRDKISELVKIGILAEKHAEFLDAQRYMGNEAAHEIKAPAIKEILAAIDIVETMLKTIYILPTLKKEIKTKAI